MNQPFRYFLNVWNLNLKEITGGFDLSSRHSLSLQTVSSVLSHSLLPAVFTFLFSSLVDMQGFIATGCDFSSHIFLNYTEICQIFPLSLANTWSPATFSVPLRNFTHWCHLSSWKFFVIFPLWTCCFWHFLLASSVQLWCFSYWPRNIVLKFFI